MIYYEYQIDFIEFGEIIITCKCYGTSTVGAIAKAEEITKLWDFLDASIESKRELKIQKIRSFDQ